MNQTRTVALDGPVAWTSVNLLAQLSVTWLRYSETDEWIEVLFGTETPVSPSNVALNDVPIA